MQTTTSRETQKVDELFDVALLGCVATVCSHARNPDAPWTWAEFSRLARRFKKQIGADFDALSVLAASLEANPCGGLDAALANLRLCAEARFHARRLHLKLQIQPHAFGRTILRTHAGGESFTITIESLAGLLAGQQTGGDPASVLARIDALGAEQAREMIQRSKP